MINSSDFNLNKVCRTCLTIGEMKSLYETTTTGLSLAEMLMSCTTVEYYGNDGLPTQICSNCVSEIKRYYNFAEKCREVDDKLQEHLRHLNKPELKINVDASNIRATDEISITPKNNQYIENNSNLDSTTNDINDYLSSELDIFKSELNHDFVKTEINYRDLVDLAGNINDSLILSDEINATSPECVLPTSNIQYDNNDLVSNGVEQMSRSLVENNQNIDTCWIKQEIIDDSKSINNSIDIGNLKLKIETKLYNSIIEPMDLVSPVFDDNEKNESSSSQSPLLMTQNDQSERVTHPKIPSNFTNSVVVLERLDLNSLRRSQHKLQCKFCERHFSRKGNLTCHYYQKHRGEYLDKVHGKQNKLNTCGICDKVFKCTSDLMRHYPNHSKAFCVFCGLIFNNRKDFSFHWRKCRFQLRCKCCEKCFDDNFSLRMHIKHEHLIGERNESVVDTNAMTSHNETHRCTICEKNYTNSHDLNQHMQQIHITQKPQIQSHTKMSCRVCVEHFDDEQLLMKHVEEIHTDVRANEQSNSQYPNMESEPMNEVNLPTFGNQGYEFRKRVPRQQSYHELSDVDSESTSEYEYISNDKETIIAPVVPTNIQLNPNNDISSTKCDKSPSDLLANHKTHERKQFSCNDCGKSFARINGLTFHMRLHSNMLYSCNLCPRSFLSEYNLSVHLKAHARRNNLHNHQQTENDTEMKSNTFQCSLCGNKHHGHRTYLNHLRLHTTAKHHCKICYKSFMHLKSFRAHLMKTCCKPIIDNNETLQSDISKSSTKSDRTEIKRYKCKVCNYQYRRFGDLKNHMKTHKLLTCSFCEEIFDKRTNLELHMRTHEARRFACSICGKTYSQKQHLKRHEFVHDIEKHK